MKRLILIILILSGLIGCAGSKKSTLTDKSKTDTKIKTSGTMVGKLDSTVTDKTKTVVTSGSESIRMENENLKENKNSRMWFFDTSKPLTLSGLPPVNAMYDTNYSLEKNTQFSEAQKNEIITEIQNDIKKNFESYFESKFDSLANILQKNNIKTVDIEKKPANWKFFIAGMILPLLANLIILLRKKMKILGYFT